MNTTWTRWSASSGGRSEQTGPLRSPLEWSPRGAPAGSGGVCRSGPCMVPCADSSPPVRQEGVEQPMPSGDRDTGGERGQQQSARADPVLAGSPATLAAPAGIVDGVASGSRCFGSVMSPAGALVGRAKRWMLWTTSASLVATGCPSQTSRSTRPRAARSAKRPSALPTVKIQPPSRRSRRSSRRVRPQPGVRRGVGMVSADVLAPSAEVSVAGCAGGVDQRARPGGYLLEQQPIELGLPVHGVAVRAEVHRRQGPGCGLGEGA
jgi:hypothetical protein